MRLSGEARRLKKAKRHLNNILGSARRRGATQETVKLLREKYAAYALSPSFYCVYCMSHPPFAESSIDHRLPVSRGGGHGEHNLTLCCKRCNMMKGDLTEDEFVRLLAFLHELGDARKGVERRLVAGGRVFGGRGRP